jgi:hypothetical protein
MSAGLPILILGPSCPVGDGTVRTYEQTALWFLVGDPESYGNQSLENDRCCRPYN